MWKLEASKDKIAHVVDHWLNCIIGGFVTEFAVDTSVSYNEAEHRFLKGPRGKYLKSLNIMIKMMLCEEGYEITLMFGAIQSGIFLEETQEPT